MWLIHRHRASFVFLLLLAAPHLASGLPPGLYPLGDLPGSNFHSHGYALSADGSVAVGISDSSAGPEAFRWTADGGMVGIGDLPGGSVNSAAFGVSADGNVIVGVGSTPGERSFRWTADGGMVEIAPSGGARAVSADGAVVVGNSNLQAYRWTEAEGAVGLGDLPGGGFDSLGFDVSADGDVVVGDSQSASGTEAFRWTAETGMVGLGDLPGGPFHSEARGVSADGSVVVGFSDSELDLQAFRWTAEGMVGLIPPGSFSAAVDVSADGSVIVGNSVQYGVFVWDAVHGVRSVQRMLGYDLSDWTGMAPQGISDDGSTIIGFGVRPNGDNEAWIAVLPEPGTLALLALGGVLPTRRRR